MRRGPYILVFAPDTYEIVVKHEDDLAKELSRHDTTLDAIRDADARIIADAERFADEMALRINVVMGRG